MAQRDKPTLTVSEALRQAIAFQHDGELRQAERLYRAILRAQPKHPDANHNLGVLALVVGKPAEALPYLQAALEAKTPVIQHWLSYIKALLAVGDIQSARQAIHLAESKGLSPDNFQEINNQLDRAHDRTAGPTPDAQAQLDRLFREGRYAELEVLARALISRFPDAGYCWHMLGISLKEMGRKPDAVRSFQQAALLAPNRPEAHTNLAAILREVGRPADAEASCRRALELKPDFPTAHCNLGNALRDLGRREEAEASCRRALALNPNFPEAVLTLGNVLKDLGRLDEAEASYRRALELRPNYGEAYVNLGGTLYLLHQINEAEVALRKAVELKPTTPEAHINLGNTLRVLGRHKEAEASLRHAIKLDATSVAGYTNLGNTLIEQDELTEAEAAFRRAIALKPDQPEPLSNLGFLLQILGRPGEAASYYQRALDIRPAYAEARSNLLLNHNYRSELPAAEVFAAHKAWGDSLPQSHPLAARSVIDRSPQRRLRIGYVSADLKLHSVAYYIEPLLREHDHSVVEVFCYSDVAQADSVTLHLKALADHWRDTRGVGDELLAQQIAEDRIDILVDLAGHTASNRLLVFAQKPAPIQVSWLGYPNTTGLRTMDYRLVDEITDPTGVADTLATERLVRLPNGFLCYAPPVTAPAPAPRSSLGNHPVTFGSFNNPAKLSTLTLQAWIALLKRVPGSRLLLKGRAFNEERGRSILLEGLAPHGIEPDRVSLFGRSPGLDQHLALYSQVDVALDPFPYNGATTTCEALWMGVPVVSLCGDRHASRVGASLLTRIGLPELITKSIDSYIDVAATLAGDAKRLAHYRHHLRGMMAQSSLCDAPGFARQIEAAYRQMWMRFCRGVESSGN